MEKYQVTPEETQLWPREVSREGRKTAPRIIALWLTRGMFKESVYRERKGAAPHRSWGAEDPSAGHRKV